MRWWLLQEAALGWFATDSCESDHVIAGMLTIKSGSNAGGYSGLCTYLTVLMTVLMK